MRHVRIRISLFLLILLPAVGLFAQSSLYAKIPQRVYFVPVPDAAVAADPSLRELPDYLYTTISSRQPIVRVESAADASAVVEVSEDGGNGQIAVVLLHDGTQVDSARYDGGDYAALAAFVDRTAASFATHLPFIEPKVVRTDAESSGLLSRVRRAEQYAQRPLELSLDAAGVLRFPTNSAESRGLVLSAVPVILNFTGYRNRNFGFVGSLWFQYGSNLAFGRTQTSSTLGYTRTLLLLPGVGITYRSVGDFYATFTTEFFGGYGYVTNTNSEAIGWDNSGSFVTYLAPGASASIFYMLLHFGIDVGYNLTPRFAIHTGISVELNPGVFSGGNGFPYPTDGNDFMMRFFSLGLLYRL